MAEALAFASLLVGICAVAALLGARTLEQASGAGSSTPRPAGGRLMT
jgi:hypothetical protein